MGYVAEWANALHDAVLEQVRASVPELEQRWPLQGIRIEAFATDDTMILLLRHLPERAVPAGPSHPLAAEERDLPLAATPEEFGTWAERVRDNHDLVLGDLIALVPFPEAAADLAFPRPPDQWDQFTETQQKLWSAAVRQGFSQGLQCLLLETRPGDPPDAQNKEPVASTAYTPHADFPPPDDLDQPIWRYMSLPKYLALLDHATLYFARADQLGDPWEGRHGQANARIANELYGPDAAGISVNRAAMTESIFISCWHAQDGESAAMWSLYAGWDPLRREGVAIRSTFRRLLESLGGEEAVYAGKVKYQDYSKAFIPEDTVFAAFMRKRRSFEHEREIRAVILSDAHKTEAGVELAVDLDLLVTQVRVAPSAPGWLRGLLESVNQRYGFDVPVLQSAMDESPLA